jgi:hypothetical protein
MKRIGLWFYYLWALLTPVHDTFIWSPFLAWKCAGIANSPRFPAHDGTGISR